jgi:hypothetical protein
MSQSCNNEMEKRAFDDPLLELIMDTKVIEIASTLMAKLEHVRYDETRRGVFRTKWALDLFTSAVKRLKIDGFDIDEWYASVLEKNPASPSKFEINPAKFLQDVETNWLAPLLAMEQQAPGFIVLLHNMMDLEDKTHTKIAEKAKKEDKYDFLGVGARNKATGLLLAAPPGQKSKLLTQK